LLVSTCQDKQRKVNLSSCFERSPLALIPASGSREPAVQSMPGLAFLFTIFHYQHPRPAPFVNFVTSVNFVMSVNFVTSYGCLSEFAESKILIFLSTTPTLFIILVSMLTPRNKKTFQSSGISSTGRQIIFFLISIL
jgi:hypothetical protein